MVEWEGRGREGGGGRGKVGKGDEWWEEMNACLRQSRGKQETVSHQESK